MNAAMAAIANTPEMQAQLLKFASRATANTPEEFGELLKSDYQRYGDLIRTYKITME